MHKVTPKVFLISHPQVISSNVEAWLEHLGVSQAGRDVIIGATSYISQAELLVALAAKRCYMAFEVGLNLNIVKVREDLKEYLTNVMRQGHGSVLGHAHFSFAIEGVSRVFTGEMNRHSAGMDISEGSMRFISFDDIGYVSTQAMEYPADELDEIVNDFIYDAFYQIEIMYKKFMNRLKGQGYDNLPFNRKKELTSRMRRPIGMGVATGGVWTGNIRALRWICELRGQGAAEEEIRAVACMMAKTLKQECPTLFDDVTVDEANQTTSVGYHKV